MAGGDDWHPYRIVLRIAFLSLPFIVEMFCLRVILCPNYNYALERCSCVAQEFQSVP